MRLSRRSLVRSAKARKRRSRGNGFSFLSMRGIIYGLTDIIKGPYCQYIRTSVCIFSRRPHGNGTREGAKGPCCNPREARRGEHRVLSESFWDGALQGANRIREI